MDLDSIDSHFQEIENADNIPLDRSVLQLLAKHGKLSTEELKLAYQYSPLYPKQLEWLNLAYRFFGGAGLLLTLSGVIFFFAYNWEGLHKFIKLGLVEGAIILIGIILLVFKTSNFVLKLGLTAISILVGVAFAVFGQIYQTGADAYDFFLGWTIFITAWVAISSFSFLWFSYLFLINTTVFLYFEQVHPSWLEDTLYFSIVVINSIALGIWEYTTQKNEKKWTDRIYIQIIAGAIIVILTTAVFDLIFDYNTASFSWINGVLYVVFFTIGSVFYIQKEKDIAFVTMVAISLLIVTNALIIRIFERSINDPTGVFFLLGFFNIGVTILLVMTLVKIHRKWSAERSNLLTDKIEAV